MRNAGNQDDNKPDGRCGAPTSSPVLSGVFAGVCGQVGPNSSSRQKTAHNATERACVTGQGRPPQVSPLQSQVLHQKKFAMKKSKTLDNNSNS